MDRNGFESFLRDIKKYTNKSVSARLSRANWIEEQFNVNLDNVISSENETLAYRDKIYSKATTLKLAGSLNNALRGYYEYKNGRVLPRT